MLTLKSSAFRDASEIPKDFTGEGLDKSPPLAWESRSDRTQQFALLCEDPDAPQSEPFVHWLLYNIPANIKSLPEAIPEEADLESPFKAQQGMNSTGKIGYIGPMPPVGHGWHRYYFKLFALDQELNLKAGLGKAEFLEAIRTHILAECDLVGRYQRVAEEKKSQSQEARN